MILSWQSHIGKYLHRCEECGEEFHGRKNQLYCNPKCKAKHNNDLATQRHHRMKVLTDDYLRNIDIVSRILDQVNSDNEVVNYDTLVAKGFDPNSTNRRIRLDGDLWYQIGSYAYRPLTETNEVELLRLEEYETRDNY